MILALKHNFHDNDLTDTFISLWTNSKFIHAQIIFSNGQVGSSWIEQGVALRPLKDVITYPFLFDYLDISYLDEGETYRYIEQNMDLDFDMVGSIFSIFNRINKSHCSEICYEALRAGGLPKSKYRSSKVTPQILYDMITKNRNYA